MQQAAKAEDDAVRQRVSICNARGLHARPSAAISKLVGNYEAHVTISASGEVAEADSIMDLLMLGAGPGTQVDLAAHGKDARAAVAALAAFIERGFDEAPRSSGD
jgi:phosphocarrier protein